MEDFLPDLVALRRSDPVAWEDAWRRLWLVAYHAAWGVLQNEDSAEDVAIEALKELCEAIESVQNANHLIACLARISRRRAIDELRKMTAAKRGGGRTTSIEELGDELDTWKDDAPQPGRATDLAAISQHLNDLLDFLGDPCRHLMIGHYWEAKSTMELALENELNASTVRVTLFRCIERLRGLIRLNPSVLKQLKEYLR